VGRVFESRQARQLKAIRKLNIGKPVAAPHHL
jgi:hypothetical protein